MSRQAKVFRGSRPAAQPPPPPLGSSPSLTSTTASRVLRTPACASLRLSGVDGLASASAAPLAPLLLPALPSAVEGASGCVTSTSHCTPTDDIVVTLSPGE